MKRESMDFYWVVGNRIRDARIYNRIRVEDLAKACGISAKHLYQIENGKTAFSTEILYRLAKELNISSDMLLGVTQDSGEFPHY